MDSEEKEKVPIGGVHPYGRRQKRTPEQNPQQHVFDLLQDVLCASSEQVFKT